METSGFGLLAMATPITELIELPQPPLRTTSSEGPLLDSRVVAHLMSGDKQSGQLRALSVARALLTLRPAQEEAGEFNILFSELRYVLFPRRLPMEAQRHTFASSENGLDSAQSFTVNFVDGKSLTGRTWGHVVDPGGLHFFQLHKNDRLIRVFIPRQNVRDYRVGPLMGEALQASNPELKADIGQALDQQQTLRQKKIGEYLMENRAVSAEQLKEMLDQQSDLRQQHSKGYKILGQALLERGWITAEQLEEAVSKQRTDHSKKLGELLRESGAITNKQLHQVLARSLGLPFVELEDFDFELDALACIPEDVARSYNIIPLCLYHNRLVIAFSDPSSVEAIDVVRFITGRTVELAVATDEDIENAIAGNYTKGELEEETLAAEQIHPATVSDEDGDMQQEKIQQLGSNAPIVRLVNRILLDAVRRRASDIHLRPLEEQVDLLFRIDGTLISIRHFSKALLLPVVSRIKIIGNMDIAEHRVPQDGRARFTDGEALVDMRISIMPTVNGESVVIRLLNTESGLKTISELGFNDHDKALFTDLLHKSYGMILVTGPTGSGKSTTLYAALQEVIAQNVNIITVEDPVEYHIDGIEQIQVNASQGYTFARALRNILRHDPDVIMIGEIRDQETAQIAVESALTGHLVLSTLHTNDAAGAVVRLLEMGIPSYLLKGSVLGVLAQRLVRRNCPHCCQEETPDPTIRELLGVSDDEVFYCGTGCDHCNNTGYSGRLAVYELLKITTSVRELLEEAPSARAIHDAAVKEGMTPLTQNALAQARQRNTSLMEVYRVRLE